MNGTNVCINIFVEQLPQKIFFTPNLASLTKEFLLPLAAVALGAYLTSLAYERQQSDKKKDHEMGKCVECLVALNDQVNSIVDLVGYMDDYLFVDNEIECEKMELFQTFFFSRSNIYFLFLSESNLYLDITDSFNLYGQAIAQINKYEEWTGNRGKQLGILLTIVKVFETLLNDHRKSFNNLKKFIQEKYDVVLDQLSLDEPKIEDKLAFVKKKRILMLMKKDGVTL
ncbi:hypothetical protein [Maridesulfovibrio frigidus]|uniref:hypothetical protein n=1 Tax=Maridesulfovibrio frigidus TaxID=340956 RepID=UPI0004E23144|nr:hypothetical protein [Maridesulfovibrio frigidus]